MRIYWSRRRRLIARYVAAGALAVTAVAIALAYGLRATRYTPGEKIEGITRSLDRTIPSQEASGVTFTDATAESGIHFTQFGGSRSTQLPEDMGSGAAWGDYDGDGLPDLYVCAISAPLTASPAEVAASPVRNRLYRNLGAGRFADVTDEAGVGVRGCSMAAAWGDFDGDEDEDLIVTRYGGLTLFLNEGKGNFRDVTAPAGLAGYEGFWTGASWADYDGDGFLDVYVCGYVQYRYDPAEMAHVTLQYSAQVPFTLNPSSYQPERNLLFRNNRDGTFREAAAEAGVRNEKGRSLSAAWCDFDMDGRPDLYVANDISDNAMYRNLGNGRFDDISHSAWVADYRGAMGLAIGDWDNDADQDIFVTHWLAQENALYSNLWFGAGVSGNKAARSLRFMDLADQYGVGQMSLDYIKWGTSFFDYDNDGRLDLLAVSGSTFQEESDPKRLVPMKSMLFWNRWPDGFFEAGARSGDYFQRRYVGRGAAFADYDRDGDADVFIVNHGGPAVLLRNDGGNRRNWITVQARSSSANSKGILSLVKIKAGPLTQVQSLGSQPSYLSQNAAEAQFGLGQSAVAESIEVRFPGGAIRTVTGVPANRVIVVDEGTQLTRR
jgi:hypothetical protein